MKGSSHPLRCHKLRNHNFRVHYAGARPNGPTEAINGRLEHLRGSALGFRNLTHYIARSLLEAGGFRPQLHRQL